jgi:hypothetical protein
MGLIVVMLALALVIAIRKEQLGELEIDDERDNVAVDQLAATLGAALGCEIVSRSHRSTQVVLGVRLDARECRVHVDTLGYAVEVELRVEAPRGILVQRLVAPGERTHHCQLGQVRGEVPEGLMPVLIAACDVRVSTISLSGAKLQLTCEQPLRDFAVRPELLVGLLSHALALAERLEHGFRW